MKVESQFEAAVNQFVDELIAREGGIPQNLTGVQTEKQYKDRVKLKFRDAFLELRHWIETGYSHLLNELEMLKENSDDFLLSPEKLKVVLDTPLFKEKLEKGESIQEVIGFSDDQMIILYHAATEIFKDQRFNAAAEAFYFMIFLNPRIPSYWVAMGVSLENDRRIDEAFQIYTTGIALNPTSMALWKSAISCCIRAQNINERDYLVSAGHHVLAKLDDSKMEPEFCRELKGLLDQIPAGSL